MKIISEISKSFGGNLMIEVIINDKKYQLRKGKLYYKLPKIIT